MTMRSGWNRRAAASASATVPASATTWNSAPAVEQRDEALADDLVVVDDEQGQRSGRCLRHVAGLPSVAALAAPGRRTSIVVPPAPLSMLIVAPIVAVLDRMLTRPWCPSDGARRRIEAVAVVPDQESEPAVVVGVDREQRPGRARVPGDVAEGLVRDAEQVGGRLGTRLRGPRRCRARRRSSSCGGTPRRWRRGR